MAEMLQPSATFELSFPPTAHLNGELCCSVPLAIWPISYYCRRETRGQRHTAGQGQVEAGLVILQVAPLSPPPRCSLPFLLQKEQGFLQSWQLGFDVAGSRLQTHCAPSQRDISSIYKTWIITNFPGFTLKTARDKPARVWPVTDARCYLPLPFTVNAHASNKNGNSSHLLNACSMPETGLSTLHAVAHLFLFL